MLLNAPNPPLAPPLPAPRSHFWRVTLVGLLLLLAWDASGLDLPLARWFGTAEGFPWRENWFVVKVLHDSAQRLGWIWLAVMTLAVFWPVGFMRRLSRVERAGMVGGTLVALLAIIWLKLASHTSCPWDLSEFGGTATYVSHWNWSLRDGGGGHCFPGGHASTGFALVTGYFGLREQAPRAARLWLLAALATGFGLGLVQQMRGAHFTSHTLWTAWICWTVAGLAHAALRRWLAQSPAAATVS
ncbi:hypothetical protein RD110_26025 [Rhodoferax koreense]|uniref:Phosphatidic acid phosphatase type 2/haloperoxidase domain-containing protein n=1 Tax=Rhodoferax koreensis TaxID=1842727 RepID=A0A1P8K2S7_9BURK|nr:phosphatase PAP2 family protein [Rhodoferax koreense]APW40231.1 hypothetical protein RD110_26025 [Rhodoferax koreense]